MASGFGRKGLSAGERTQTSRGGFGNAHHNSGGRAAVVEMSESDSLAARRNAFIDSERLRVIDGDKTEIYKPGISDAARSYKSDIPKAKNIHNAYIFWFFLGNISAHRFYLGAYQSAFAQIGLLIFGVTMIFFSGVIGILLLIAWVLWVLGDIFLIPGLYRRAT